mmetsp:Transcript_101328/g.185224  ORF Transcript_101328/g.185224 Transcript_101328/m.185224 type:complete len:130 (+) Transcript_101328:22-411(+)
MVMVMMTMPIIFMLILSKLVALVMTMRIEIATLLRISATCYRSCNNICRQHSRRPLIYFFIRDHPLFASQQHVTVHALTAAINIQGDLFTSLEAKSFLLLALLFIELEVLGRIGHLVTDIVRWHPNLLI